MDFNNITTIIWDWNGTLLNDISHCIKCMNVLLQNRGLELLTKERYLNVFTFPVKDYYTLLGFEFQKEPFEIPAEEFIVLYQTGFGNVPLYDDATDTLKYFNQKGIKQFIVSAMQHDALVQSVEERNIAKYFEDIYGIHDNLAFGKTNIARQLIIRTGINPKNTLLIGDTLHDAEVAKEIGVKNLLISRGHQHHLRLLTSGNPVMSSLNELKNS